ncbi:hypothetical protein AB205_0125000, partial [Aquarana catesbeiana]
NRNEVVITENNNSITEQITDVVKQPAFIAGIGGACWVILMGFSIWLYWRRKKRKGLSNYADSPDTGMHHKVALGTKKGSWHKAVTFQRGDGGLMSNGSRPGLLNASDPSYPWLADSWPASSMPVNNSNNGPNDLVNFGCADVLPTAPGQGEKSATMLSDGAIYSSIDFTTKSSYNCPAQTTPYATTQILHSNSIHELAVDLPDQQWKSSVQQKSELTGLGYCLPDQGKGNNGGKGGKKKKIKNSTKNHKNNGSNWANVPLPPPPIQPLPGTEIEHYGLEHQETGYDSDGWCPPLPVQTYLHQGSDDELEEDDDRVPTPPVRGVASSPAISFGQQSTATLTPSPREEMQPMLQAHLDELTRAYQFDIAKQTWHLQSNNHPPMAPVPPMGYVSGAFISELEKDFHDRGDDDNEDEISRPLRGLEHTPGSSMDNLDSSATGKMQSFSQKPRPASPFSSESNSSSMNPSQRPRPTKKHKGGRIDQPSSLRREGIGDDEVLMPYSKPNFPSPGGHSSSGTTSSKDSTGPRKGDIMRGHQRNAIDFLDVGYLGPNSQGQFTEY